MIGIVFVPVPRATATIMVDVTPMTSYMVYGSEVPTLIPAYNPQITPVTAPICTTTATSASSAVYTYDINCSGAADPNYTFRYLPGTMNVTKAPLAVSPDGGKTKVYGEAFANFSGSLIGIVNNDNITAIYASAGANSAAHAGSYNITATFSDPGNKLRNYSVTNTPAVNGLVVGPAILSVAALGIDKEYNDSLSADVMLSDNRIAGDILTLSYGAANFDNKNFGNNKEVGVNGINIAGSDAENYIFNTATVTTANIFKAPLVLLAQTNNKTYDGTIVASAMPAANGLKGDDSITGLYEIYDDENIGTNKTLSIGAGYSVNDENNGGNYTISEVADNSGEIIIRGITVKAGNVKKEVGENDPILTYDLARGSLADGDAFSGNLSRNPGESIGTYNIIQNTLSAGPNYDMLYEPGIFTITATTNGAPVATADNYQGLKNTTLNVSAPGILSNDADINGDTMTAIKLSDTVNGLLVLYADGSFSYSPNTGFMGNDIFTYKVFDGKSYSNTMTVAISVKAPAKSDQNVEIITSAPQTAAKKSTFIVEAIATSNLSVTITTSGNCSRVGGGTGTATVKMGNGNGICSIHYDQAGNSDFNAAPELLEEVSIQQKPSKR